MRKTIPAVVAAAAVVFAACGSDDADSDATDAPADEPAADESAPAEEPAEEAEAAGDDITLWLAGTDTPEAALDYLTTTYTETTGGDLSIEQIGWGDLIPSLTACAARLVLHSRRVRDGQHPDRDLHVPSVRVQRPVGPTTTSSAATPYSRASSRPGRSATAVYSLPYYFGSRFAWYRKDLYEAAGVTAAHHPAGVHRRERRP